ncbi:MAG: M48 family metallopeptidase [Bacteroidetes bacterium]|nr:M48 family metallopeptidase [Bacteroidota bacterium]MBL6943601.1 M48 family metallopeptidase [Bacteroidales bacterium]
MKKLKLLSTVLIILFFYSCSTVPITGRKQISMIPDNELMAMSFQQYDEFLNENPPSRNNQHSQIVKSVGFKIQKSVEKYMADNNLSYMLNGYNWEFNLVENDQINAWCMPGGKVVVYTGIIPVTKNETGLAVVMGHEIAHAIAGHGNERLSQELLRTAGGIGLMVALNEQPQETQQLWMTVYGVGTELGAMLPYSRLHESEADRMGLIFMAMAGYNPNEAPVFWERMSKSSKGHKPPEFLSTHPSDQTRIDNLNSCIPEAMEYYNKSKKGKNTTSYF